MLRFLDHDQRVSRNRLAAIAIVLFLLSSQAISLTPAKGWSIASHVIVTGLAVDQLPEPWRRFFQNYAWILKDASVFPDTYYRNNDPEEDPRHYIDLEIWNPFDPSTGTLPQAVEKFTRDMVSAIRAGEWQSAFMAAGRLSHYVADACQPYHTTVNYNPVSKNGVELHAVLDSSLARHFSEFAIRGLSELAPVENVTRFMLDTAWQSHSFLPVINKTLIEDGFDWSPELTRIIENRTNTAIVSVARVWYTALLRAEIPAPPLGEVNRLTITVKDVASNPGEPIRISIRVTDGLGLGSYANVSLAIGEESVRGLSANLMPPFGEYVFILHPGAYSGNATITAQRQGYVSAIAALNFGTQSTVISQSTVVETTTKAPAIPFQTMVGILGMAIALIALMLHRRAARKRSDN